MLDHETVDAERFEDVIQRSVRQILLDADPDRFLAWARGHFPALLGMDETDLDETEQARLANLLGMAIWSATPQPSHAFQILPLPPTPPAAPCPCGSGYRHRDCCGASDEVPRLSTDLMWEVLLGALSEADIRRALALDVVPKPLLARIADHWLEQGRPRRAVRLLEPLFADQLDQLESAFEPAIDVLCDAYDDLKHNRKKRLLLARLCAEGSRALQAAAWQRRCTMAIDEGEFAAAEAAFTAALRSDPDNPSTAILEITLLAARHKDWIARERARFWLYRLRRIGVAQPGVLDFLRQAIEDPQDALVESYTDALDPALLDLQDWISLIQGRPLPEYRLDRLTQTDPASPPAQLALFDDLEDAPLVADLDWSALDEPRRANSAVQLRAPTQVRALEAAWHARFPLDKPRSTGLTPVTRVDPWESDDWLAELVEHPGLADSLEVLDDLATALYLHPSSALPWIARLVLQPILERAAAIIQQTLPADSPHQIPWSAPRNRPALRLLLRHALYLSEAGESGAAAKTLETLLRLNPRDHQGVRADLMNHYLRDGEDELALGLARRFPNDTLADMAYGEVLALYRLGRQDRARLVLSTAVHRLPRIPHYLTRKRVKRPRLTPAGMSPGGDDQAWMYREAMRDVWEAEPGILAWLRRLTA